jgi:hypothetical protein
MLASAQFVSHRAALPAFQPRGSRWIPGEGCRIGRERATGPVFLAHAVSIAPKIARAVKAGRVQEASHSQ